LLASEELKSIRAAEGYASLNVMAVVIIITVIYHLSIGSGKTNLKKQIG
jgi:hypothetical protein